MIEAREQQHVVDERTHSVRLFFDAAHRLREVLGAFGGAPAEQLGVTTDRGERRSQLVRRVADEAPKARFGRGARLERGLDPLHHLVEREAEPPDLGLLVDDVDPTREIAGGDRARGLLHVLQGTQPELREEVAAYGRQR